MQYLLFFLAAFFSSVIITPFLKLVAPALNLIDLPSGGRKIHTKPIPLIGGIAIYISFFTVLGFLMYVFGDEFITSFSMKHLAGIFLASTALILGGVVDDIFDISANWQMAVSILAVLIVIASGIGINSIGNPFGEVFKLDTVIWNIVWTDTIHWKITLFADIFTLVWLLGVMYTTKLMDGLDGLVTGVSGIGAFGLFALSLTAIVNQPSTAMLAIILAGACFGFLVYNFFPASAFLGTSGSLLTGFLIGVLAILSGAKVATTLFILGVPIVDLAWVIIQRKFIEKKSIADADKKHLHFRLLDLGYSQRDAVLFIYALVSLFAVAAILLQNIQKFYALTFVFVFAIALSFYVYKKTQIEKP